MRAGQVGNGHGACDGPGVDRAPGQCLGGGLDGVGRLLECCQGGLGGCTGRQRLGGLRHRQCGRAELGIRQRLRQAGIDGRQREHVDLLDVLIPDDPGGYVKAGSGDVGGHGWVSQGVDSPRKRAFGGYPD